MVQQSSKSLYALVARIEHSWHTQFIITPPDKDENLLKTIGYFWSDALNCFLFSHGPMTITLLDVTMITGLDISSPNPAAHKMAEVPFKLSSKVNCINWGTYMSQHMKTKGPVTEKEHTAFLNLWLEHFIFCGPSLLHQSALIPGGRCGQHMSSEKL